MMDSLLLYKILKNRTGAEISASGNPAIMSDTLKNNPMNEMKVFGWSKQERTTGAQLIDTDNISTQTVRGVTLTNNMDGTLTATGMAEESAVYLTIATILMKKGETYNLEGFYSLENGDIESYIECGNLFKRLYSNRSMITAEADESARIKMKCRVGVDVDFTLKPFVYIGKTALPYEPYTGGQPSPSPDYPQEIVSAGNSGNIEVNVRGKNLVDVYGYSAISIENPEDKRVLNNEFGTTLKSTEKTDQLIVNQEILDGGVVGSYKSGYFVIGINRKLEVGKDYIITFRINVIRNPLSASHVEVSFNGIEFEHANATGDKVTVKAKYTEYRERQYVEVRNNGMSLEISNFMITEKDENTIYEPYYEPQTISISTPTGLPAIPVDSDGNYTDANGQQWIVDYVDLKRGKYVQRVWQKTFDGSESWGTYISTGYYLANILPEKMSNREMLCDQLRRSDGGIASDVIIVGAFNANTSLYIENSTLRDNTLADKGLSNWKAHLAEHPLTVMTYLNTPIERNLTQEEIQAYKALKTYNGTTIVENDAECYMEVSAGGGDVLRAKKLALLLGD